jgi:hypothetical protein
MSEIAEKIENGHTQYSVHVHEDAEAVQQKHHVFVRYIRANEDSYCTNK